jgi:hypothetical protein
MENENNIIICPNCKTENHFDFSFCKSCGRPLKGAFYSAPATPTEINGVPVEEVKDYIGKNSDKFLSKFWNFSGGGKFSWNWPVLLFGLLGVPFVWFFYRKMPKLGALFLAISLTFSVASACVFGCTYSLLKEDIAYATDEIIDIAGSNTYEDEYGNAWTDQEGYNEDLNTFEKQFLTRILNKTKSNSAFTVVNVLSNIMKFLSFAYIITLVLCADKLYYNKVFQDIDEINSGIVTTDLVKQKGGTKTASAVLSGIFGYIGLEFIASLPAIILIIDIILKIFNSFM